ncbi:Zinc finger, ring/fyve/phd-type, partial [Globisporangium splendens]
MAEPMDVDAAAGSTARKEHRDAHTPCAVHTAKASAPARAEGDRKGGLLVEKARDAALMPQAEKAATLPNVEDDADTSAREANIASCEDAATAALKCRVCGGESSEIDVMKFCDNCQVAVHSSCYGVASSDITVSSAQDNELREANADTSDGVDAGWRCDCCAHGILETALETLACVLCEQPSNGNLMKHVDTCKWLSAGHSGDDADEQEEHKSTFGHALCARWDPHRLIHAQRAEAPGADEAHTREEQSDAAVADDTSANHADATEEEGSNMENGVDATKILATEDKETDAAVATENTPHQGYADTQDTLDFAFPAACCFCGSSNGTRIKCQKLHCGIFFHAMCAHQRNGFLEIRRSPHTSPLVQYHAYCARHAEGDKVDAMDVVHKLVSPPVAGLIGRDAVSKLQTITRRIESGAYPSIFALCRAVANVLVDLCRKGLRMSKADLPAYNVKHLQAMQFFLDHTPQLQIVYSPPGAATKSRLALIKELVDDNDLVKQLQKTFDPPKYLGKYAGPVCQVHSCDVCTQPFHERQHLFYCANETTPHAQHWKCTKRRSNSRERDKLAAKSQSSSSNSSTKKKLTSIALVRNGQWKDIKLPKGLPGISDEIICGICRSDVHAQGLIASRKEGKRAEFEKKSSAFVQSGCFQNPVEAPKSSNSNGVVAKPPLSGRASGTSKADAKAPVKPAASERNQRSNKRNSSVLDASSSAKAHSSDSSNQAAVESAHPVAQPVLGPPKMERINVQRTTKWLACVAQIIRLAGAAARLSNAATASVQMPTASAATPKATAAETHPKANDNATAEEPASSVASAEPHEEAAAALKAVVDAGAAPEKAPSTTPSSASVPPVAAPAPPKEKDSTQSELARLSAAIDAYFDEAMRTIRPFDAYVLHKLETAQAYLRNRNGPAVAVLRMIAQEYTRFIYVKHTRAVEKATNEKRKREEQEAQEQRELERKRLDRDAELALKSQMLAMRKKQRKHVKLG